MKSFSVDGSKVYIDYGDCVECSDALADKEAAVAIERNEKELAQEHLRLDTITWGKALAERDKRISRLTSNLCDANNRYIAALELCTEKDTEIATLRAKVESLREVLHKIADSEFEVSPALLQRAAKKALEEADHV